MEQEASKYSSAAYSNFKARFNEKFGEAMAKMPSSQPKQVTQQQPNNTGFIKPTMTVEDIFPKLVNTESSGQHYDASGKLTTSSKGAEGITQLMPETQKDPGFGVSPAKDKSQSEFLRVGKDYLNALHDKYNDWEIAVAAYNAGPGNVNKALESAKKEGKDWKEYLPDRKQTIPYINKVLGTNYEVSAGNSTNSSMKALETKLNPSDAERNIINYHRNTIKSGKVGSDEEGRPVTVYSTGLLIQEGPNKGKFVAVPGYVNGKVVRDEDQLYKIWKKEIDAGKWPMYKSGSELNKRSEALHQIMDDEESIALQSRAKAKK